MDDNFIKLEIPILYENENDLDFTIIDSICVDNLKFKQITIKGKSYNYDEGKADNEKNVEIVFDLSENIIYTMDKNGKILD